MIRLNPKLKMPLIRLGCGVAVWLFLALFRRYFLYYQEQTSFFLTTWDFLKESLAIPGGLARYVGLFCRAFFSHWWTGAALMALLLAGVMWVMELVVKHIGVQDEKWMSLTVLSGLLLLLRPDPADWFALFAALLTARLYLAIPRRWAPVAALPILAVLYLGIGASFYLTALLILFAQSKQEPRFRWNWMMTITLLFAALWPFLYSRLFHFSAHYFAYWGLTTIPVVWWVITLFAMVAATLLPSCSVTMNRAVWGLIVALGLTLCFTTAKPSEERVIQYSYLLRNAQWDRIVELAEKRHPEELVERAILNCALAQKGTLGNELFRYTDGAPTILFLPTHTGFFFAQISAEIFYRLGFVNDAERLSYEAYAQTAEYAGSASLLQRIAITHIINGEYPSAERLLRNLQQTLFYRKWASSALGVLRNEEAINSNVEWGVMRRFRIKEDLFFPGFGAMDFMLAKHFDESRFNLPVYSYLLSNCLLTKNLSRFTTLLRPSYYKNGIPVTYQEALIQIWGHDDAADHTKCPEGVSTQVYNRYRLYLQRLKQNNGRPTEELKTLYGNTYWYYYDFVK